MELRINLALLEVIVAPAGGLNQLLFSVYLVSSHLFTYTQRKGIICSAVTQF